MNLPRSNFHAICLSILITVLAGSVHAGYLPYVPTLQPYQVVSPNGRYLFEVKPSHRYGSGPSMAILTKQDTKETAWKRELPYTFWQACVNDDGTVGGFGYSKGPMGGDPWALPGEGAGEFIVRILDVEGATVHEEARRRISSGAGYFAPSLSAEQLFFDAESDRMIIRIQDIFRNYSLREGCLVSAVVPVVDNIPARSIYCETARLIPHSPLLLVQLEHFRGDTKIEGTVFGVMDERGKWIWSVNYENKVRDEDRRGSVTYRILSVSSFVPPDENQAAPADPFVASDPSTAADPFVASDPSTADDPQANPHAPPPAFPFAQCDIYFGNTQERVTYHVLKAESERDVVWSVAEVKRVKWTLPEDDEPSPPKNIPRVDAKKLGEFQLLGAEHEPLDGIAAVAMGPDEQIYALESDTGCVDVYDRAGKPLHVCKPGKEHRVETGNESSLTVDDHGEVFVKLSAFLAASEGEPGKSNPEGKHFLHFSPQGIPDGKLLAPTQKDNDENWLAQPKSNRFIVTNYKPVARLVERGESGSQVAALTHRADGHWLDTIGDVCFASDGSIALLSIAPSGADLCGFPQPFPLPPSHLPAEAITLYKADGTPIRTIDFTAGVGLSKIAFDGTHIVATGDFDPPSPCAYLFKATGEVVGVIRIEGLVGKESIELVPFIVDNGSAILIIDCASAKAFRYAMPK